MPEPALASDVGRTVVQHGDRVRCRWGSNGSHTIGTVRGHRVRPPGDPYTVVVDIDKEQRKGPIVNPGFWRPEDVRLIRDDERFNEYGQRLDPNGLIVPEGASS